MAGRNVRTTSSAKPAGRSAYGSGRVSTQRLAIAGAVEAGAGHAFSVEELAETVRERSDAIGLATVYRAVAAMESAGFIESLGTRDGRTLYARCAHVGHHHHLMCTECGAITDVECPVPAADDPACDGFRVTGHRLVLFGVCGDCER